MAAALVIVALLHPGRADGAVNDVGLEARIEGGLDGYVVPGRAVPIRVTLTSQQLRSGDISVTVANGPTEVVPFEIAGGAAEEHWVLLDVPGTDSASVSVTASVDGREVDLGRTNLVYDPASHLIGRLDGLGGLDPGPMETSVGAQAIHLVDVSPAVLDLGPNALAALDSLAVTPDDVAGLSDSHRQAILGWLALGGTLYVDAPPGALTGWPDELQPTTGFARVGEARVVATGGALAAGGWSDVVLPAPARSLLEDGVVAQGLPFSDPRTELFGIDLGRDLPPLSELLGILAVYAVLVGPVVYLLFRRRVMGRWVAIPVLALVATGVLFVRGGGPGAETTASVVDVIQTGPGPAMATSRLLMATDVGDQVLEAPAGWIARAEEQVVFGAETRVTQRRNADGVEISIPAVAGGVGTVSAQGPVPFDGALEVSAVASDDGTVTGTVRNTTGLTLEAAAVFFGRTAADEIGVLQPGATADFTLTGTNETSFGNDILQATWPTSTAFGGGGVMGPMPAMGVDGGQIIVNGPVGMQCDETGNCVPIGMGGTCPDGQCESGVGRPGSLDSALRSAGSNTMGVGVITAVGWATDAAPVVDLGSDVDVVETRTAVVGRARPTVPGDRLVDSGSGRRVVTASNALGNTIDITFSQELPADVGGRPVDLGRLRMHMPLSFGRVEFLVPGGTRLARDIDPNDPGDTPAEVVVPPEAVVEGRIIYRVSLRPTPPPPGLDMLLYEVSP